MNSKFSLYDECSLLLWDEDIKNNISSIDCGESDLNDFFANDAILYSQQLLGKTYVWITDNDPKQIVAAFTVSND